MKTICKIIFLFLILLTSCKPADNRIRLKPKFKATPEQRQEIICRLWRIYELKKFEDWYAKKYEEQKGPAITSKSSEANTQYWADPFLINK